MTTKLQESLQEITKINLLTTLQFTIRIRVSMHTYRVGKWFPVEKWNAVVCEQGVGVHPECPAETTRDRGQQHADGHEDLRPLEVRRCHSKLGLCLDEGGDDVTDEVQQDEGTGETPVQDDDGEGHTWMRRAAGQYGSDVSEEHVDQEGEACLGKGVVRTWWSTRRR